MNIVSTYLSEKETLDHLLPSSIIIGPFQIRIEHIRLSLSDKHKALAIAVLDMLAKTLHSQVLKVSYMVQWIICLCLVLSFCFCFFVKWPKGHISEDILKITLG